jgi:hypothetical protein
VSGTPSASSGTPTREASNDKGFWLQGTTGSSGTYNATVMVSLSNVPAKFNWCAYASDYPPNATMNNGTYTLKGTPPFTINTTITENGKNSSGTCITSLTDRTACPGIINNNFTAGSITSVSYNTLCSTAGTATTVSTAPTGSGNYNYQWTVSYNNGTAATISGATATIYIPPATATAGTYRYVRQVKDVLCNTVYTNSTGTVTRTVGSTRDQAVGCGCTSGLTAVGGYCRDLNADDAGKFVGCGYEFEIKLSNVIAPNPFTTQQGCPAGWRPANLDEYICIHNTTGSLYMVQGRYATAQTHSWGNVINETCCQACSSFSVMLFENYFNAWCNQYDGRPNDCNGGATTYTYGLYCWGQVLAGGQPVKCIR